MKDNPQERLQQALALAQARMGETGDTARIGTLAEKTLHAALKFYIEPDPAYHEVPYLGFVADVRNERGVFEIQTRSFDRLRRKLDVFLAAGPVTLVCPLPHVKYLYWLDGETGEVSRRRKSPLTGQPWHLFRELDRIREQLGHPHLTLLILLLDLDEYRNLDGWSRDRKRGSSRLERIPLALHREVWLREKEDWLQLIPPGLPPEFTRAQLQKAGRLSERQAAAGLRVLTGRGLIEVCGKQGRAYLYRLLEQKNKL